MEYASRLSRGSFTVGINCDCMDISGIDNLGIGDWGLRIDDWGLGLGFGDVELQ